MASVRLEHLTVFSKDDLFVISTKVIVCSALECHPPVSGLFFRTVKLMSSFTPLGYCNPR